MVEIFILISLCKRLGVRARDKGKTATGYQTLLVVAWFAGEIGSAIVAAVVLSLLYGDRADDYFFIIWLAGIFGAALAAWFVFKLVAILPDPVRDDVDDDDDDLSDSLDRGDDFPKSDAIKR